MIVLAALLFISGIATIGNVPSGGLAAAIATILFVAAAFWANYALFDDIRPLHSGTNIVVATIILVLLWLGYHRQQR
jgi:hypothetical protein